MNISLLFSSNSTLVAYNALVWFLKIWRRNATIVITVVLQSLDLAIAAQAVAKSSARAYMVHTTTWLATLQHQVQLTCAHLS